MTHRQVAKVLAWLLFPLALLGIAAFLFLFYSIFSSSHTPDPWNGNGGGNGDLFSLFFFLSLLIYIFLGILVWWVLILFAYESVEPTFRPATAWGIVFGFNICASLYWIFLAWHEHDPQIGHPEWCYTYLYPLVVTIPVSIVATNRLFFKSRD